MKPKVPEAFFGVLILGMFAQAAQAASGNSRNSGSAFGALGSHRKGGVNLTFKHRSWFQRGATGAPASRPKHSRRLVQQSTKPLP